MADVHFKAAFFLCNCAPSIKQTNLKCSCRNTHPTPFPACHFYKSNSSVFHGGFKLDHCISDAIRTAEHSPHTLSGISLQVSLLQEFEDENTEDDEENMEEEDSSPDENDIIIIVSGISPSTTEDAVRNYFENSRRSGGGEVSSIAYSDDGETVITFLEVKGKPEILSSFLFYVEVHITLHVMR